MKLNCLGNTGILIGDLSLGTLSFGDGTSTKEAENMVAMFADAGGNHIDTANVYGNAEEVLGKIIAKRRDQLIIASKIRFSRCFNKNDSGLSRRHILMEVEASLKRMQIDHIDLLYLHGWDPLTPLPETMRACDDLITSGKVGYLGVSNFTAWQLMKALYHCDFNGWHRFVVAQYQYSLLMRDIEYEFTDLCQHEQIGLMPWGPLAGGFLSGKNKLGSSHQQARTNSLSVNANKHLSSYNTQRNWSILAAIDDIATRHKASYCQIALAWLRKQPVVSSVIMGARNPSELKENLGAANIELSSQDMQTLEEASALEGMYPYGFHKSYCARYLQISA